MPPEIEVPALEAKGRTASVVSLLTFQKESIFDHPNPTSREQYAREMKHRASQ